MTKNQREFQKEIARLQRSMKRLLKKDKYVPLHELPTQPKRVTRKMITRLQQMSGRNFVEEIDIYTGEVIYSPSEPQIYSRKPKAKQYAPNYEVYQEIVERFKEAEQAILSMMNVPYLVEIAEYRLKMVRHLIDTLEHNHEENDGMYVAYLQANQDLISELLSAIQWYDSDQPNVDAQYTELLMVLRMEVDTFRTEYAKYKKGGKAILGETNKTMIKNKKLTDFRMEDLSEYAEYLQDMNEYI